LPTNQSIALTAKKLAARSWQK